MISFDITIKQLAELFETKKEVRRTNRPSGIIESIFDLGGLLGECLVLHGVGEGGVMIVEGEFDFDNVL